MQLHLQFPLNFCLLEKWLVQSLFLDAALCNGEDVLSSVSHFHLLDTVAGSWILAWQENTSECMGNMLVQWLEMKDKNGYTLHLMWLTMAKSTEKFDE